MKRTTLVMSGIVLLGLLVGLGVLFAQNEQLGGPRKRIDARGGGGGFDMLNRIERFADEIDLTDDQIDQIKKIRDVNAKKVIDIKADKGKTEIDLRNLMQDSNAKSSDIEKVAQKVMNKENEMKTLQLKAMLQIRDVLTPVQREQLKETMQSHRREMQENRHEKCSEHGKMNKKDFGNKHNR
ncbi:Spy/CpxP family protein refolding chaperone [bacterium]|nr:Spy/CpxP family protein refolding chaperone [bacterium]